MRRLPTPLISRLSIWALVLLLPFEPTSAKTQGVAMGSPAPETKPTDAQMAGAVLASASANITLGALALKSSSKPAVRRFGEKLVTENTLLVKATLELSQQLAIIPAENLVSASLTAQAQHGVESVLAAGPVGFDRRFVSASIAYQQTLIETLDGLVLPNVLQSRLEDLLVDVRSATQTHLEEAHKVEATLEG